MSLLRQGRYYLVIGLLQYVVDWGVMVALSHFGLSVEIANVLGPRQLRRFMLLWLCMTGISTWSIGTIENVAGLRWAWLAKPLVEIVLACVSFMASRHWVYRP
jgi:putative flippase GtrA